MNTLKLIFGSIILAILMAIVIPIVSAVFIVMFPFALLAENSAFDGSALEIGLALILIVASPLTYLLLVYILERELWISWYRKEGVLFQALT